MNLNTAFKKLVPSEVCIACKGCCRFPDPGGLWRPFVAQEEKPNLDTGGASQAPRAQIDPAGFLKTEASGEGFRCLHLCDGDNTCGVYPVRPFECALYPFVFAWHEGAGWLAAHLSCPYVQEHWGTRPMNAYCEELIRDLSSLEVTKFIRRNPGLFHDYSAFDDELVYIQPFPGVVPPGTASSVLSLRGPCTDALGQEAREVSAYSFAGMAAWEDFFGFQVERIRGSTCVFAHSELGTFLYFPPLGDGADRETVEACFEKMDRVNAAPQFSRVEHVTEAHRPLFPAEDFEIYKKGEEYCYRRADIAALEGGAYKSRRGEYNQAVSRYAPRYERYRPEHFGGCCEVYARWAARKAGAPRRDDLTAMIGENRGVHANVLASAEALGVIAAVVTVDGVVRAYTAGYPLTERTFCVMLEVADPDFPELATYIFRQFCQDPCWAAYDTVNTMDDMDDPDLRRAKESFRPSVRVPVYTVTKKTGPSRRNS